MIVLTAEQGTNEWHFSRKGVITGTKSKKVFSKNNLDLVDELIAELGTEDFEETYTTSAMQRGIDLEPIARKEFEYRTGLEVYQIGLAIHNDYEWLGYSSDGYVGGYNTTHDIEIKCPNTKTHVKYIRMGGVPTEYIRQIIHGFVVNPKLEKRTFISYDDRYLPMPYWSIDILRKDYENEINEHLEEMLKFRKKFEKYYNKILF